MHWQIKVKRSSNILFYIVVCWSHIRSGQSRNLRMKWIRRVFIETQTVRTSQIGFFTVEKWNLVISVSKFHHIILKLQYFITTLDWPRIIGPLRIIAYTSADLYKAYVDYFIAVVIIACRLYRLLSLSNFGWYIRMAYWIKRQWTVLKLKIKTVQYSNDSDR